MTANPELVAQLVRLFEQVAEQVARRVIQEQVSRGAGGLVTVKEFSRARSISPSTTRAAIRDGRLQVVRVGRAVRVAHDAVIAPVTKSDTDAATRRAEARLGLRRGGAR